MLVQVLLDVGRGDKHLRGRRDHGQRVIDVGCDSLRLLRPVAAATGGRRGDQIVTQHWFGRGMRACQGAGRRRLVLVVVLMVIQR